MGVHSKVWGQYLWRLLHTITYTYDPKMPQELIGKYIRFFHVLKDFIPCPICRNHYTERCNKNPPERNMKTTDELVSWLNNLHNEVNAGLGKPLIAKRQADMYYVKDGKLTYDFRDFIILFRILTIMKYINYPAVRRFLELLFEIYPDKYMIRNAPKSYGTIESIVSNPSLNVWIIFFDNEFAKNRKMKTYLNIEIDPRNESMNPQLTQKTREPQFAEGEIRREGQLVSQGLSERHSSRIVKDEVNKFLKKYQLI